MNLDAKEIARLFHGEGQDNYCIFSWNSQKGYIWYLGEPDRRIEELFQEQKLEQMIQQWALTKEDAGEMRELIRTRKEGISHMEKIVCFHEKGEACWRRIIVDNRFDENGACTDYLIHIVNFERITGFMERVASHLEYDRLTGIYNADKFFRTVSELIQSDDRQYVLIRFDFDRFKIINDLFGEEEGDAILKYVAYSLGKIKMDREPMCYCRVISDVFAICMSYTDMDEVIAVVKELDRRISEYPIQCRLTPNYGIYPISDKTLSVSIMLDYAKMACRSVKGNIVNNYAVYAEELREQVVQEMEIERDMESALAQGQFKLFLQPKYDISTGRIIGAEALCRWQHPQKGMISPMTFIPLFERNGFVVRLDRYMWEETCKVIRKWLDLGYQVQPVSLNVSRMHAYNNSFEEDILQLVERYQIPSQLLELELTESAYLAQEEGIYKAMNRLKEKGLLFSVDDFGTGYSSLNMLKSIPVDIVKLDRAFLNETTSSTKGRTIIRNMITLANELNIRVIAEGVECVEQAALLLELGCELAQGYYYSKPLSVPDFERRAFGEDSRVRISSQIRSVLGEKERFLEEMRFLQGLTTEEEEQQMFSNPHEFRRSLVERIKKYRKVLLGISDIMYEFDMVNQKSAVYFNNKGLESRILVENYEQFYQKTMERVHDDYEEYIQEVLHPDTLRRAYRNGTDTLDVSFRVNSVMEEQRKFVRHVYFLIGDKEGTLQEIVLCVQSVEDEKTIAAGLGSSLYKEATE